MSRFRSCLAEIMTTDGEIIEVEYGSFYPLGSRGNYLDMTWRASLKYDIQIESAAVDSIHLRYKERE